jgi:hypothetical protein
VQFEIIDIQAGQGRWRDLSLNSGSSALVNNIVARPRYLWCGGEKRQEKANGRSKAEALVAWVVCASCRHSLHWELLVTAQGADQSTRIAQLLNIAFSDI